MASFEVWDVIKVPFPHTDRPVQQRRPALVIAVHGHADLPGLLWVLMITSASHRRWAGDVEISDLGAAGLAADSIVRISKIATVEAPRAETIGCLPPADQGAVCGELARLMAVVLTPSR